MENQITSGEFTVSFMEELVKEQGKTIHYIFLSFMNQMIKSGLNENQIKEICDNVIKELKNKKNRWKNEKV